MIIYGTRAYANHLRISWAQDTIWWTSCASVWRKMATRGSRQGPPLEAPFHIHMYIYIHMLAPPKKITMFQTGIVVFTVFYLQCIMHVLVSRFWEFFFWGVHYIWGCPQTTNSVKDLVLYVWTIKWAGCPKRIICFVEGSNTTYVY